MKKINLFLSFICIIGSSDLYAQEITKLTSPAINGTVCPVEGIQYEVSSPGELGSCEIQWTATNGDYSVNSNDQRKVTVNWKNQAGASAKLTATFVNCNDSTKDSTSVSMEELILSVKDQTWDTYDNSVNVD